MDKEEIYNIWRPDQSIWSAWVKPVLFSFMMVPADVAKPVISGINPAFVPNTIVIADLPGAEGIACGIAFSRTGYRPVPVYNACPYISSGDGISKYAPVEVDVLSIISALAGTADDLRNVNLPASAPPVFLLDSNRRGKGSYPPVDAFDNRSFVTIADFPSADFLKQQGISQVVLIQRDTKIIPDLLAILLEWQNKGIFLLRQNLEQEWKPEAFKVRPLSFFARFGEFLMRTGYHRSPGIFGGIVHGGGG